MRAEHRIGQYRILRRIGAGGMGWVFAAEHVLLGRRAAIKVLLPSLSSQSAIAERFFKEARVTSAIAHPGIVQVFDFGYHVDGTAYIVMELLEGESLLGRIARLEKLPVSCALRIARQVASSLAAAHASGVVHRDLKPDNIFLIRDCEAQGGERTKVLDFGICKVGGEEGQPAVFGTPVYMSPEQCRGAELVDHRTDIYALGCVLFEMLTGRTPFERPTAQDLIEAHLYEAPPSASSRVAGIPSIVDDMLWCCLAKSPDERYPSMTAFGAAIEEVLASLGGPAETASDPREATASSPSKAVPLSDSIKTDLAAFRSVFDDRAGTNAGAPSEPASPVSSPPLAAEVRSRSTRRRAAIGVALLAAAAAVSIAIRFIGGGAVSAAPPAALAARAAAAPVPAPTPLPPVLEAATEPDPRAALAPPSPVVAPVTRPGLPVPAPPMTAAPPPRAAPSPPPSRGKEGLRAAPRASAPAPASAEDLYDER